MNPLYEIANHFPDFRPDLADQVPEHLRAGLARYVLRGIRPGAFLSAVISNDLRRTILSGTFDEIRPVVVFLFNSAPSDCSGSAARRSEWRGLANGGDDEQGRRSPAGAPIRP